MLSVASVLARQDVDPWREAASLAGLPPDAAIRRLIFVHRRVGGPAIRELGPWGHCRWAGGTPAARGDWYRASFARVGARCRRRDEVSGAKKSDVLSVCVRRGSQHRRLLDARCIAPAGRH
jgi:hypothetical protein